MSTGFNENYPDEWIHGETLSRADVARIFNVDPATVTRWAKMGVIGFFRAPRSANRIFPECEIKRVMRDEPPSEFVKFNADRDNAKYKAKWESGWRNNGRGRAPFGARALHGDDDDDE